MAQKKENENSVFVWEGLKKPDKELQEVHLLLEEFGSSQ